ncbi:MAG: tetratricopeptide repeat protein [Thermoplasmata archaeon]|nr:tetratricopeptide repeat protein [Thermoplasmata archaeon]
MASGADTLEPTAPIFGRTDTVEALVRRLHGARDGQGGLVVLVGEGGVGKSALLRNLERTAQSLGYAVVRGRALPTELPQPFALLGDVIRSAAETRPVDDDETVSGGSVLPMFLAPFGAGSPPETISEAPAPGSRREAEEANRLLTRLENPVERVQANRAALFAQLTDFLLQLGEDRPLLVALDDLAFADDSSLEFLQQFGAATVESRVLVVGTTLPLATAPARSQTVLERLVDAPETTRISLRAMAEPDVAQFVRWLLNGRDPGRDAVMRWFTQTEGNPLFVEHLVRASMGFGTPPAASERHGVDFDAMLKARIQALGEDERRVLVHAAVLGKEFDFTTLVRASAQEEERLSESVDRLVHGGLLREKGGEVYEFVSERARADVYAELTETRRRILHRKAAIALEERTGTPAAIFELARQSYLGHDDSRAVEYNRRAADLASAAFAFDSAIVHLERALESARRVVPRDNGLELRLLIELGGVLCEFGDLHRSEEMLLDAVGRARSDAGRESELALSLLGLARTRSDQSRYGSSRELATEAFQVMERLHNARGLLVAHRVLGVDCWRLGDLDEAEGHQREAIRLAERSGSATERGHALIDLANTLVVRGAERVPEATELYDRAAEVFAQTHDHSARARVLMNRALLSHNSGRMVDAVRDMTTAIEAAERSRSRIWIGYCHLNMAQFQAELKNVPAARTSLDRAVAQLAPLGDQLADQQATMARGMIAEVEEKFDDAASAYAEALASARQLGLGPEIAEMQLRLGGLAVARKDPKVAREWFAGAREAGILELRGDLTGQLRALEARLAALPTPS